jgi:hypothetical protein
MPGCRYSAARLKYAKGIITYLIQSSLSRTKTSTNWLCMSNNNRNRLEWNLTTLKYYKSLHIITHDFLTRFSLTFRRATKDTVQYINFSSTPNLGQPLTGQGQMNQSNSTIA